MVVLAEEDHRDVEAGGEGEGLRDIALAGGAVAEVGDGRAAAPVELHSERVAGGVQGLSADNDGRSGHSDV